MPGSGVEQVEHSRFGEVDTGVGSTRKRPGAEPAERVQPAVDRFGVHHHLVASSLRRSRCDASPEWLGALRWQVERGRVLEGAGAEATAEHQHPSVGAVVAGDGELARLGCGRRGRHRRPLRSRAESLQRVEIIGERFLVGIEAAPDHELVVPLIEHHRVA